MKPLTDAQKQRLVNTIKYMALAMTTATAMAMGLTSCNVTRTITTESKDPWRYSHHHPVENYRIV